MKITIILEFLWKALNGIKEPINLYRFYILKEMLVFEMKVEAY